MATHLDGRFAVLAEETPCVVAVAVPAVFRFADTNPVTGTPYATSPYSELPSFAAWVVCEPLNLEPGEWNVLVADGETADWVDPAQAWPMPAGTSFRLGRFGWVRQGPGYPLHGQGRR